MAAVARGGDRQLLHEHNRQHSHAVTARLKAGESRNDLLDRLRADPAFAGIDFDRILERGLFVGRAPQQVDEFIEQEVAPIRKRYQDLLGQENGVDV
jgi:adenylosuccinate lyase